MPAFGCLALVAGVGASWVVSRFGRWGKAVVVAAGAGGRVGAMLGAANEQDAIAGAMADCAKHDSACRVIGIGPFAVEPK